MTPLSPKQVFDRIHAMRARKAIAPRRADNGSRLAAERREHRRRNSYADAVLRDAEYFARLDGDTDLIGVTALRH